MRSWPIPSFCPPPFGVLWPWSFVQVSDSECYQGWSLRSSRPCQLLPQAFFKVPLVTLSSNHFADRGLQRNHVYIMIPWCRYRAQKPSHAGNTKSTKSRLPVGPARKRKQYIHIHIHIEREKKENGPKITIFVLFPFLFISSGPNHGRGFIFFWGDFWA